MNNYAEKLAAALSYLGENYQMHPNYEAGSNAHHPRIGNAFEMHKWRVRRNLQEF